MFFVVWRFGSVVCSLHECCCACAHVSVLNPHDCLVFFIFYFFVFYVFNVCVCRFAKDSYDEDYRSSSASSCGSRSGDKKMEPCRNKRFEPYQMTRSKDSKGSNEASRFDEYYGPCRGKGRDVSLADSHAIPYENKNKNLNNNKNNNKNGGNNFSNNSMQSPDIEMNSNATPSTNFTQAGLESPKSRQYKLSVVCLLFSSSFGLYSFFFFSGLPP